MLLQRSGRTVGLIEPACHRQPKPRRAAPTDCTRSSTTAFASCRRDAADVRLYIRNANDFTKRFPLVVAAVVTLPARSCLIDGEAIVNNDSGLAVFQLLRSWLTNLSAVLFVFELLELDGEDLPRLPIEVRKAGLAQLLLRKPSSGIAFNEHYVGDGKIIYQQACKLGCEGIVSKRLGSLDRSTVRIRRSRRYDASPRRSGVKTPCSRSLGMQEDTTTTDPVVADIRNFYKVEVWTRQDFIERSFHKVLMSMA